MSKKHWDGIYKNAEEITPEHLLDFYLMGDSRERREAQEEILRRLHSCDKARCQHIEIDQVSMTESQCLQCGKIFKD